MRDYSFTCHSCGHLNHYRMIPLEANAYINCSSCDETSVLQVRDGKVMATSLTEKFVPWTDYEEYLR